MQMRRGCQKRIKMFRSSLHPESGRMIHWYIASKHRSSPIGRQDIEKCQDNFDGDLHVDHFQNVGILQSAVEGDETEKEAVENHCAQSAEKDPQEQKSGMGKLLDLAKQVGVHVFRKQE